MSAHPGLQLPEVSIVSHSLCPLAWYSQNSAQGVFADGEPGVCLLGLELVP